VATLALPFRLVAPPARAPKGAPFVPAVIAFMNDVPHLLETLFHRSNWAPRMGELDKPRAYGMLLSHVTYAERMALPHGVQRRAGEEVGSMKRYGRAVFLNVVALGAEVSARRRTVCDPDPDRMGIWRWSLRSVRDGTSGEVTRSEVELRDVPLRLGGAAEPIDIKQYPLVVESLEQIAVLRGVNKYRRS